jgi:predicted NUDIX family NTP pyrophosphohydrolase
MAIGYWLFACLLILDQRTFELLGSAELLTHSLSGHLLPTVAKASNFSAGLLLYRRSASGFEVFLAHPGGPFWRGKETGAWTIPKGLTEAGEDPLTAARREFEEETGVTPREPFLPLGSVRQKAGKVVQAWAWEGNADPARITSNVMRTEWPRGSGRWLTFPEVDRCGWFDPATARLKINPAQVELIDRLQSLLERGAEIEDQKMS